MQFDADHPKTIEGSQVPVLFGPGALLRLGDMVRSLGGSRVLLVTDKGLRDAGHVERAVRSLYQANLAMRLFDDTIENPTTKTVDKALLAARPFNPDIIVGLGGGSSMDTAKGVNFLHSNGGRMQDYVGTGKATKPMLPLIAIPTTAGTGSEAQSYALISDADTHTKMACGDKKALPRLAILDPELLATCPAKVAAATGIDAVTHAVETAGCNKRTEASRALSKQAWNLLESSFEKAVPRAPAAHPARNGEMLEARARMQMGAHLAGCAIENAMLGAAHATANPLTAQFDVTHGVAVGLMLPHVVRFNSSNGVNPYSDLVPNAQELAERVEQMLRSAGMPTRLAELDVPQERLSGLAALAAKQWTATFNPRPVGEAELLELYKRAY